MMNWILYGGIAAALGYFLLRKPTTTEDALAPGSRVMLDIPPSVAAMFRSFDPSWTRTGHVCATITGPVENGHVPVAIDGLRAGPTDVKVSQQNIIGPC